MNATETTSSIASAADELRILIVDDELPMQVLATSIVNRLGYKSSAVGSGEEALAVFQAAKLENRPFGVIVMDLALPGGMSGLEATIAIKQISPDCKVIVSSGYLEQNARGAALEHGFAGILPKPYTADRLASELRYVMKDEREQ